MPCRSASCLTNLSTSCRSSASAANVMISVPSDSLIACLRSSVSDSSGSHNSNFARASQDRLVLPIVSPTRCEVSEESTSSRAGTFAGSGPQVMQLERSIKERPEHSSVNGASTTATHSANASRPVPSTAAKPPPPPPPLHLCLVYARIHRPS